MPRGNYGPHITHLSILCVNHVIVTMCVLSDKYETKECMKLKNVEILNFTSVCLLSQIILLFDLRPLVTVKKLLVHSHNIKLK